MVLLPDLASPEAALEVAEKLVAALQEPFELDGVKVDVASSAGVATTPGGGSDFDELLQHADIAMYVAKPDGLAVVAYAPELDSYSPTRLTLLAELRERSTTRGRSSSTTSPRQTRPRAALPGWRP